MIAIGCDRAKELLNPLANTFERIHELAGPEKLIVAGHDPQVSDRFKHVEPGIVKIA